MQVLYLFVICNVMNIIHAGCWCTSISVCKFLSCSISFFVGVILIQYQIKHKILVIQWIYLLCCLFVNLRIYFGFLLPKAKLSIVLQCLSLRIVIFSFSACLLDLFQIFSVYYVFCFCYRVEFWCFNVKYNLNNLSFKFWPLGLSE
jgi:hypothetical protein